MFPIPLGCLKKSILLTAAVIAVLGVAPARAVLSVDESVDESLLGAMQLEPDSVQNPVVSFGRSVRIGRIQDSC